jgi:hypothetical protein
MPKYAPKARICNKNTTKFQQVKHLCCLLKTFSNHNYKLSQLTLTLRYILGPAAESLFAAAVVVNGIREGRGLQFFP